MPIPKGEKAVSKASDALYLLPLDIDEFATCCTAAHY